MSDDSDSWGATPLPCPPLSRLLLHVKVLGGRAFTEYVARQAAPGEKLVLHGELFGQRFSTRPAAAAAEPELAGEAYIELPESTSTSTYEAAAG